MDALDKINSTDKEQKLIRKLESEYSSAVLKALQLTYGDKRVKIANMKIEMDMSEKSSTSTEYTGIKVKDDNPETPWDDSVVESQLPIATKHSQAPVTTPKDLPELRDRILRLMWICPTLWENQPSQAKRPTT